MVLEASEREKRRERGIEERVKNGQASEGVKFNNTRRKILLA